MGRFMNDDSDVCILSPRMTIKVSTDQFDIPRIVLQRIGCRVNADETVLGLLEPIVDEIVHILFGDREIAGCVEQDNIEPLKIFSRDGGT